MPAATRAYPHPISRAVRGLAVVCALMVWVLGLLAASSQLHVALHAEAGHSGHSCAITLFSQGLENSLGHAELIVTPALFRTGEIAPVAFAPLSDAGDRLPPGRGPPVS